MKYYTRSSLEVWLQSNQPRRDVLCVICDVANGITAMHREEFVHCDLKPDNILIDFDSKRKRLAGIISDLGISKITLNQQKLAVKEFKPINIRGMSVSYAAPETIASFREIDKRSAEALKAGDVYSFSCILYRCVNMQIPWSKT